jgi:hypothetical protein
MFIFSALLFFCTLISWFPAFFHIFSTRKHRPGGEMYSKTGGFIQKSSTVSKVVLVKIDNQTVNLIHKIEHSHLKWSADGIPI